MKRGLSIRRYDTAVDRSTAAGRRFVAAWTGLVLLLFNVLGAAPLAGGGGAPSAFAQSFDTSHLVVCTTAGMVVIDAGAQEGEASGHGALCFLCLPLFHAASQSPAPADIAPPEQTGDIPVLPVPGRPLHRPLFLTGAAGPRAPPTA